MSMTVNDKKKAISKLVKAHQNTASTIQTTFEITDSLPLNVCRIFTFAFDTVTNENRSISSSLTFAKYQKFTIRSSLKKVLNNNST